MEIILSNDTIPKGWDISNIWQQPKLDELHAVTFQKAYAIRLPAPGAMDRSIPLAENPWVQKEIESFQTKERGLFEEGYKRAGLHTAFAATNTSNPTRRSSSIR